MHTKCRMQMSNGDVKTYKSKNGKDFVGPNEGQYKAPQKANGEILERQNWLGITVKRAFYFEGIATAVPIALKPKVKLKVDANGETAILDETTRPNAVPRVYGPKDVANLEGDFLATLIASALKNDKRDKVIQVINLILSGLAFIAAFYAAYLAKGLYA